MPTRRKTEASATIASIGIMQYRDANITISNGAARGLMEPCKGDGESTQASAYSDAISSNNDGPRKQCLNAFPSKNIRFPFGAPSET